MNYNRLHDATMLNFSTYLQQRPRDLHELVLHLNRDLAGRLGLDPNYTISTNIALAISRVTGMPVATAKLLFHGGVASFVAAIVHLFGAGSAAVIATGALCWGWLESFDSSVRQR
jgi:hypothetical protein